MGDGGTCLKGFLRAFDLLSDGDWNRRVVFFCWKGASYSNADDARVGHGLVSQLLEGNLSIVVQIAMKNDAAFVSIHYDQFIQDGYGEIEMRLVSFRDSSGSRFGLIDGDHVIDAHASDNRIPKDLSQFLKGGGTIAELRNLAGSKTARPVDSIVYDLPITSPGKIFCLGLNYLEHVKEGPYQVPDYPTIFMRGASSLVAHNQAIVRPTISDKLDFEAELVVVIGKRIRHANLENALDAVFAYSCFNDGTLRDYQKRTVQWTVGKNFDKTGGFGPVLVTPDELPLGAMDLNIQSRLNGQVMQSDNTKNMMFPVAETISTITAAITLEPGDMIVMGTPSGVGYARKPPVFMKAGDVVEIEIEGIGTLRNPIIDEVLEHDLHVATHPSRRLGQL